MTRIRNKTLLFFLALTVLINLQIINAHASEELNALNGTCGQNATWTLDETTGVMTISGTGAMTDYASGSSPWYQKRSEITSIVVENGITHVGNEAFSYATKSTSVDLADTVTSIGYKAFNANYELSRLSMPSIETIGNNSFSGCYNLSSVDWPKQLHTIGSHAFYNCKKLTDPVFTDSLKSMGEYAFAYCDSIQNISLPASLTSIAYYAFDSCKGLKHVTFEDGAVTMNGFMFRGCSAIEEMILPDGLKTIPEYAFADCTGLRWIWIPPSVTSIGESAFETCCGLTHIALPGNIKRIGKNAFYHCLNLQSAVYFGTEATWNNVLISDNNEPITSISIEYDNHTYTDFVVNDEGSCTTPKIISYIADDQNQRMESIPAIGHQYKNDICTICNATYTSDEDLLDHGYCTADIEWRLRKDGTLILSGTGAIPNYGVRTSAPWYDYHEQVLQAVIEEGITYLGGKTLAYSIHMTELSLPDSMTEIGPEACSACYVLQDVKLPANLKKIGSHAFFDCYTLPEINFPDTLEIIGEYSFYRCEALKSLDIPESVHTIEQWAFPYCDGLTDVTLPEGLCSLGDYAFDSCKNLNSVHLPESLTYLGMYAFRGCSLLTDFNIPHQITTILQNTFDDCDSLTKVELPENVKQLDYCAFYNCNNLTDVVIQAQDCKFGVAVFEKCSPSFTLWGFTGSPSETYALKNGLNFKSIGTIDIPDVPDIDNPDTEEPDIDNPDIDNPDIDNPDIEEPDIDNPDIEDPGIDNPGIKDPDVEEKPVPIPKHQPVRISDKKPSCTETGNNEYWRCTVCNKYFKDKACTHETTPTHETIAALGHRYQTIQTKATLSKNGSIIEQCSRCKNIQSSQTIFYPKKIALSRTSYVYSGTTKKPSVIVTDSSGKRISSAYYTVKYSTSFPKKVGRYIATISFKTNYTGTVKKSFTIIPKNTKITGASAKSRAISVKWKKEKKEIDGYQLQYSERKNFKSRTKTLTYKNNVTSKKIAKLKAKKKYYIRIRTYKKASGRPYYSSWSSVKTVTTRK